MEEKPAGNVATATAESPASAEPASSRRRAGGLKRKASAFSSSVNSSTPSKRLTREKAAISNSPIHNGGPLTRARQSPNNLASSASSAAAGFKLQEKLASAAQESASASAAAAKEELLRLEELKASIEADFEVIRSRESKVHVVPNHCGWFSWTKIHPLEERTLPSFFNGKSEIRTPEAYMEIRNWIVKKFHKNPTVQIELKDVLELEVADADAKQEVLEFLDFWGLINFHPFPQVDSTASNNDHGVQDKEMLIEKLFRFESIQPSALDVSKPNLPTPDMPSRFFPESSVAEELLRPEEPSVEYHCNSCSADCSRKRYHCQKQADYDLCADCFSNRKFASNMSASDFILMEPAEAPGQSSGKWTDQETLLLLEALELYKENWNEIAEHVATKTKAQCILHFLQMPIEDAFFDDDGDPVEPSGETKDPPTAVDDSSTVTRDETETKEDKAAANEDQPHTSPAEAPKVEGASDGQQESVKSDSVHEAVVDEEKVKDKDQVKAAQETSEEIALKALTEAFEGVGYPTTDEKRLSFADVGNPVMALAAFLGNLVGSEVATASALTSLKALNSDSPGIHLATRHCFILEDPPDEQKDATGLDRNSTETGQNSLKGDQDNRTQKGDGSTLVADGGDASNNDIQKGEDKTSEEKLQQNSSNGDVTEKVSNEVSIAVAAEQVKPGEVKKSSESELQKDPQPCTEKESNEKSSLSVCAPTGTSAEGCAEAISSQPTDVSKDVDMVSDAKSSQNTEACQSVSVEEPSQAAKAPEDALAEKNEKQEPMIPDSTKDHSQPTEAQKDVDMMPSEEKEPQKPVASDPLIENGVIKAEGINTDKNEKSDCKDLKGGHSIDKLKRAAISALSAAAVKAKVLADQEEDQIRLLAASLIEKQLHKLEMKVSFFNEMDHLIMRVREQLDRSRQKLYQERAQIISARLGVPPSSSRAIPPALSTNRIAANFANSVPRPPMGLASQRPPVSRPMGTMPPSPANPFASATAAGNPLRPSGQDTK